MKQSKRTVAVLVLLLIAMACAGFTLTGCGQGGDNAQSQESAQTLDDSAAGGEQAAGGEAAEKAEPAEEAVATLFFASDYQIKDGWPEPKENLTEILEAVAEDGKSPTAAAYMGDYTSVEGMHDYQLSPEDNIQEIREVLSEECPDLDADETIFVQGNHDRLTESISDSGLHEYDDYLIYVVNTENDFPWRQGQVSGCLKKVRRTANKMEECFDELIERGESRPVFIAGHVPLHYTARTSSRHSTGDNLYASLVFDVVNEAAESLDIVYLFGHNHSKGWDCYMGGGSVCKKIGDTVIVPAFKKTDNYTDRYTEETLAFTYLNAGYTGYYMNCGPEELEDGLLDQYESVDEDLTGTICEIYPSKLVLTRYDEDGRHRMGAKGEANPYKDYIDTGLIDEKYYSVKIKSPLEIRR